MAGGALVKGHVDDPVDLVRRWDGTQGRLVPLGASGLLGFAGFGFLAAERVSLAMLFASGFVQALTEFAVLYLHLDQAADQTMVLALKGLLFLHQHGQPSAQVQKFPAPAGANRQRIATSDR
jgi:hypothetical protein